MQRKGAEGVGGVWGMLEREKRVVEDGGVVLKSGVGVWKNVIFEGTECKNAITGQEGGGGFHK